MKLYPLCLKTENLDCLVVGGGQVALRKVRSLLDCGAKVTVLSPDLCPGLARLVKKKVIGFYKGNYLEKYIRGRSLIIAATDDEAVNRQVAQDAFKNKLLVNVVDKPELCNFFVPAVVRRKELLLTVSSGGSFPGLTKKIRQECGRVIQKHAANLPVLAKIRKQIVSGKFSAVEKKKMIKFLLSDDLAPMICSQKIKDLNDLVLFMKKS